MKFSNRLLYVALAGLVNTRWRSSSSTSTTPASASASPSSSTSLVSRPILSIHFPTLSNFIICFQFPRNILIRNSTTPPTPAAFTVILLLSTKTEATYLNIALFGLFTCTCFIEEMQRYTRYTD